MFVNKKNYSLLIGSGKIFIMLLLISALHSPILCQNKKYAIVSNIGVNGKSDRSTIEYLTDLIKKEPDINVALILGDVGSANALEELKTINSLISENELKVKIIPGYNNYSGGILNNYQINQELYDVNFSYDDKETILLGFNSVIPFNKEIGFVNIETINFLKTELASQKDKLILLFSNMPLSKVLNASSISKAVDNNRIVNIYPEQNQLKVNKTNILEVGFPGTGNSNDQIYHIIEQKNDSIYVHKKHYNNDNDNSVIVFSESLEKLKMLPEKQSPVIDINSKYQIIKKIEFNSTSSTNLSTADNRIYLTLDNGLLYLIDFKGTEKFVTEIFGTIQTDQVLYKDLFLVATINGDLYSINSNNGEIIQVVGIGENITSDLTIVDLDKTTKSVALGTARGNIFAYDAFTFEILWNKSISNRPIISKPFYTNDKLFFIDEGYSIYCVNAKSGVLIWKYSQTSASAPADHFPISDEKSIFILSPEGNIIALDMLQGKKIWSADIKTSIKKLYLNKNKTHIYALTSSGKFFSISVKDGKVEYSLDLNKSNIFSFEILELESNLFIGLSDGSLYSISESRKIIEFMEPTFNPITDLIQLNNLILIKDINGNLSSLKYME